MSAKKRDINLFKAAGGEKAKARKRPITSYLTMGLVIVVVAVIGVIVFLNFNIKELNDKYNSELNIADAYQQTAHETANLIEEYRSVVAGIYQAQKINEYLDIRRNRYTKATSQEISAIEDAIVNSNTAYTYLLDVNLKERGNDLLDKLDKTYYNYDLVSGAILEMIEEQKNQKTDIWHHYYRGQLVVVFSGGLATGVNLEELAVSMYEGIMYNGVMYEPFMDISIDGARYVDASYVATAIDNEVIYNVMMLTMKSVEERAIDILEATSERLYQEATISGNLDDFRYDITRIMYDNTSGTLNVRVSIIESEEYTMRAICDDLHTSAFFRVSRSVVSPPELGEKSLDIILEIRDAHVGGAQ